MQHQETNSRLCRQGGLQQPRMTARGTRWLYVASCAFCTAAFVTGLSFLFALHLGLEALALYHPHLQRVCPAFYWPPSRLWHACMHEQPGPFVTSERACVQEHFVRASMAQFKVSQAQGKSMAMPAKVLLAPACITSEPWPVCYPIT